MRSLHLFFQTLFQVIQAAVVRALRQMYLHGAMFTTSCMVISVVAFSMACFGGSGKNAFAAGAGVQTEEDKLGYGLGSSLIGEGPRDGLGGQRADAEAFGDGAVLEGWLASQDQPGAGVYGSLAKGMTGKAEEGSEKGSALIGDVLKEDTLVKLESEQAVRDRVGQAQKEIRVQQVADAARQAEEAVRKKEEEARRAALRIPYSEEDYQVMLQIVQAEAGGCDSRGKILVANVIMNRVRSSEFPDDITSVVYEKSQFSPVSNGSINRVQVTEDTIECVNRALDGEDYSQGALYFMNRSASYDGNVRWFDGSLSFLFSHGGHEFFK